MNKITLIDCTLRDGGYHNAWNFSSELIEDYLQAMSAINVDYVELGFRSFDIDSGFRGACAYTTDNFISSLRIPQGMKIGVMINAAEVVQHPLGAIGATQLLFRPATESPVTLVRFACHLHEFEETLPACEWLKDMGYTVGINLMQIADRADFEITQVARAASRYELDALYFADSMGSMNPEDTARIVRLLASEWAGAIGIHTHDNMGMAVSNTLRAIQEGANWVDCTVTGMGRGPGNAQTEYIVVEMQCYRPNPINMTPLLRLVREHFLPMKNHYGWGINTYYYLAGKYGIHPTYVQEMLADPRFSDEDILAVIEHLRQEGGKKFSLSKLESARHFYKGEALGNWAPAELISGREVLLLGSGPGVQQHRTAIESFIRRERPLVIALNAQTSLDESLIDLRAACHPMRLLADASAHTRLPQPLITPASTLPSTVATAMAGKHLLDFGIKIDPDTFKFHEMHAVIPSSLVVAYALAIAASGHAKKILLAGFDGYGADDQRRHEADAIFRAYLNAQDCVPLQAITPTQYDIPVTSVYAI